MAPDRSRIRWGLSSFSPPQGPAEPSLRRLSRSALPLTKPCDTRKLSSAVKHCQLVRLTRIMWKFMLPTTNRLCIDFDCNLPAWNIRFAFRLNTTITDSSYASISFCCPVFPAQLSNAINLKEIAEKTEGYSGSDLRELCRDAAMYRVRDYVRKEQMRQIAQQLGDCQEEEKYDSCSNTHKIS